jgi:hypothetical protein
MLFAVMVFQPSISRRPRQNEVNYISYSSVNTSGTHTSEADLPSAKTNKQFETERNSYSLVSTKQIIGASSRFGGSVLC